ncbi:MAG: metal-dependent transcriptional regulator [Deinococcaceae bacterium]
MSTPMRHLLSSQAEDYLKAIYLLGKEGKVTTQKLSGSLQVTPASVSGMLKKLADLHLVEHKPYYGAVLTENGQRIALEILRHHRLLELYLTQALGYSWDTVHEEADRLEHVISEEFEAKIAQFLGNPQYDPHGHPIPSPDGTLPETRDQPLPDFPQGSHVRLTRVSKETPEFLRYLESLRLLPGSAVWVGARQLLGEVIEIQEGSHTHVLSLAVANHLWGLSNEHA